VIPAVWVVGISIGGMWALKAASGCARQALYDLGGPIKYPRLSAPAFLIKDQNSVSDRRPKFGVDLGSSGKNSIEDDGYWGLTAAVRMIHGGNDGGERSGQQWLRDKLLGSWSRKPNVSFGDYCRRRPLLHRHAAWVRDDMIAFFNDKLGANISSRIIGGIRPRTER